VLSAAAGIAARHWLLLLLLAAGAALRVVAFLAYRPALLSSPEYITSSQALQPGVIHPVGYPAFLRALQLEYGLAIVPFVQHVFGLVLAVLLYALLLRLGVRRWLAALAAAPVLLDAYQLSIEQHVTPEALFELFLVAGLGLLLWRPQPSLAFAAVAGLLFAAAALTRTIGVLVIVPALLTLVFLRARRRRTLALVCAFAAPLVAYVAWFDSFHGQFALTGSTGRFLYGRVVPFAECEGLSLPAYERVLCPKQPVGQRPPVNDFLWGEHSQFNQVEPPPGATSSGTAGDFAKRVIVHQPFEYTRAVGSDMLRAFAPTRTTAPGEFGPPPWQFHIGYPIFFRGSICSRQATMEARSQKLVGAAVAARREHGCAYRRWIANRTIRFHGDERRVNRTLASFLHGYQRFGYTPGPLLAAGLFVGLVAACGLGRARRSGLRTAAFLFSTVAVAVCLGSVVLTVFSWRYQVPQLVLLPPALVLGLTALAGRPEGPVSSGS
jgi:hypothetical protein